MEGPKTKNPRGPRISGAQFTSPITSTSVGARAPLLLLIHLRNKMHPHYHYMLTLSHTHSYTPPITPLSHQIGGGGQAGCETSWSSAQTKKPAECALASKRLSDLSHSRFFMASPTLELFHFTGSVIQPNPVWGGLLDYKTF